MKLLRDLCLDLLGSPANHLGRYANCSNRAALEVDVHIAVTTELLGEHPALLNIAIPELNDESITSWVRGGDGLIGFGVYKSHIVKGAQRFQQARSWWQEQVNSLDIHNNLHGTGTGPILFTSFSFDPSEESHLLIPQVVVGQRNGKSWITWIGAKPQIGRAHV